MEDDFKGHNVSKTGIEKLKLISWEVQKVW